MALQCGSRDIIVKKIIKNQPIGGDVSTERFGCELNAHRRGDSAGFVSPDLKKPEK